ncbi:MAG: type II toxin-antitoxin system HicB family antitoxin [Hyphomicrobiales bacterium]|nr:type II toxin-antitoxin system HicB family antitoxin [Hyphomicrobiales bacterium]MBV9752929.1 type II toxin-antitoxin system HicB family antitoxin [Hyphomicrobiales bacterium]
MAEHFIAALVVGLPGNYVVIFPDFPGAGTSGHTVDEALARAADNIATHIEFRIEEGLDMPRPSSADEALSCDDVAEALDIGQQVIVARIPVDIPGKIQRLSITLDEALIGRIDKAAARIGESRSGFLAAAARERIASLAQEDRPASKIRKRMEGGAGNAHTGNFRKRA